MEKAFQLQYKSQANRHIDGNRDRLYAILISIKNNWTHPTWNIWENETIIFKEEMLSMTLKSEGVLSKTSNDLQLISRILKKALINV